MSDNLKEFNGAVLQFAARDVPQAAVLIQKKLGLEAFRRIVKRTPVDTGYARGQWQATIDVVPTGQVDPSKNPIAEASAVISKLPPFVALHITNNTPYIEVIENGTYAPPYPENTPEANARRAARRTSGQRRNSRAIDARARGLKSTRGADGGVPFVSGGFSKQAPHGMVSVSLLEILRSFQ